MLGFIRGHSLCPWIFRSVPVADKGNNKPRTDYSAVLLKAGKNNTNISDLATLQPYGYCVTLRALLQWRSLNSVPVAPPSPLTLSLRRLLPSLYNHLPHSTPSLPYCCFTLIINVYRVFTKIGVNLIYHQ